jgi:hypothetical protein
LCQHIRRLLLLHCGLMTSLLQVLLSCMRLLLGRLLLGRLLLGRLLLQGVQGLLWLVVQPSQSMAQHRQLSWFKYMELPGSCTSSSMQPGLLRPTAKLSQGPQHD